METGDLALAVAASANAGPAQHSAWAQSPIAGWAERDGLPGRDAQDGLVQQPRHRASQRDFSDADEEQKFTDYYNLQLFPNITHHENRQSARDDVIAKLRNDLKACEDRPSQDVFNKLTDLTLAYMTRIAADSRFHPAVRVNAMLAIGEVNSPKAARRSRIRPPTGSKSSPFVWLL